MPGGGATGCSVPGGGATGCSELGGGATGCRALLTDNMKQVQFQTDYKLSDEFDVEETLIQEQTERGIMGKTTHPECPECGLSCLFVIFLEFGT